MTEKQLPGQVETDKVERLSSRELRELVETIWVGDEASERVTEVSVAGVSFVRADPDSPSEVTPLRAQQESWPIEDQSGFEWPVTKLEVPEAWRDQFAACIMPNLKKGFGHTTSLDRIAFECAPSGELVSFAMGDGVSSAKASAGVADVATRYFTRTLASLPPQQFPLSQKEARVMVEAMADRLFRMNPLEEIQESLNAARTPEEIANGQDFSTIAEQEAGGTTLLGGSIRRLENGDLKVTFIRLGDGGYVLINPLEGAMYDLLETPIRKAPAQLCVGLTADETPLLDTVAVEEITVQKGCFLVLLTDGVPRSQVSQTIKWLHRDRKGDWSAVPAEGLARLILEDASGLNVSAPQEYDDRSVVVIKA